MPCGSFGCFPCWCAVTPEYAILEVLVHYATRGMDHAVLQVLCIARGSKVGYTCLVHLEHTDIRRTPGTGLFGVAVRVILDIWSRLLQMVVIKTVAQTIISTVGVALRAQHAAWGPLMHLVDAAGNLIPYVHHARLASMGRRMRALRALSRPTPYAPGAVGVFWARHIESAHATLQQTLHAKPAKRVLWGRRTLNLHAVLLPTRCVLRAGPVPVKITRLRTAP